MTLKEDNKILLESLSKMIDVVHSFAQEGQVYENWKEHIDTAKKLVDNYTKKEDNYYEETANDEGAKDTDKMPDKAATDIIPGTDVMYRPYREPQVDNSAIENHETAGQESDGEVTGNQTQYPSTEISV